MTRKLSTALVLALVLMMALSVAAFAQGPAEDAPYAPQDGTGYRFGRSGNGQAGVGRMADGSGQGVNFVDADNDGTCDNFIDEDGDGVCDSCDGQGGQMMGQRSRGNQSGETAGMVGRSDGHGRGRGGNGTQGTGQRGAGRGGNR
jgi:hypothetical protein